MRIQFASLIWFLGLSGIVVLEQSTALATPADLSGWVGSDNLAGTNNYTSTLTTAGGTFQERFNLAFGTIPYLADDSLTGGPLGFDTTLGTAGSLQFDEPAGDLNPSMNLGWYDSTNPTGRRLVLAPADTGTGNDLRWVILVTGNGGGTQVAVLKDGSNSSIPDGTYSYSFNYDSVTKVATAGIGSFTASLNVASTDSGVFDRFGFFQPLSSDPNATPTYVVQISDINYTGETQIVPEPCALLSIVVVAVGMGLMHIRRR